MEAKKYSLSILSLGAMWLIGILSVASANGQIVTAPALAGQMPCMGNPKPIEHLIDVEVGKGQAASKEQAVFVRLTKWNYNAKADDFKGAPSGLRTQIYDFSAYGTRRFEGSQMQQILDGIIPVDATPPMQVGGRRAIVVPCSGDVIEIELAEVAASKGELKANAAALAPPPPAIANAMAQQQRGAAPISIEGAARLDQQRTVAASSEADKQYCNEEVQKHLRAGGIASGAGYVFSQCMDLKIRGAKWRLAEAERAIKGAELKQQRARDLAQIAAQVCPAGAQPPTAADSAEATMYGLSINMPMPCLPFCPHDSKAREPRLCVDELTFRQTAWGTASFKVFPSTEVFGLGQIWSTGVPVVEIVSGRIVGLTFDGGFSYSPEEWLQALTKKFGKYQLRGKVYLWETSTSSARLIPKVTTSYAPTGSVDLLHPGGDGIVGTSHDEATFSIYVPTVRARKDAYEATEELKNRKEKY